MEMFLRSLQVRASLPETLPLGAVSPAVSFIHAPGPAVAVVTNATGSILTQPPCVSCGTRKELLSTSWMLMSSMIP